MNHEAELAALRSIHETAAELCASAAPFVRDVAVLLHALSHDALRQVDINHPPPHLATPVPRSLDPR